jgi:tRNA A-37 threonylcarbamoyl transferase component Bud32
MKKLGRYEILDELGRGAMGHVYRARDPEIDRVVALKTFALGGIDAELEAEFRQRFFREAKAAGKLLHPGIVTIFDVGEDPETKTPFIVMEYIEGRSLEAMGRQRRLPPEEALGLVKQIAEALDYAHTQGIVHRDIKPANIIVTPKGQAKIADFGVAKLETGHLTQTGMVMGTPIYMSPEQMVADPVDGRSDLFSLVSVLYWLLTREHPFAGKTMATLSFKIVYSEPLPPSSVNPALGEQYDSVVHRGLAKERERRYQTGRELADDLDDLLHGRPLRSRARAAARPAAAAPAAEPGRAPAWDLSRVAAAVVLVGLLVGVAWWIWPHTQAPAPGDASAVQSTEEALPQPPPAQAPARPTAKPAQAVTPTPPPATKPVPKATLLLQGQHAFGQATLSLYVDGKLLKRLDLRSQGGLEPFSAETELPPGDRVVSVTILADNGRTTRRAYLGGAFRDGQTRTLQATLQDKGRGKLELHWLD